MTRKFISALLISSACLTATPALAKSWIETAPSGSRTEAKVTTGAPVVMRTDKAFSDIMVADAGVADVVVLTDRSFHLMGKTSGKTNIMLYDNQKRLIDIVDVNVGYDVAALKKSLFETFPGERIEVRPMAGGVYLSGKVSGAPVAERAVKIAQRYAPNDVTNGLIIKDSHQVLLEVRFVEASREAVKDLGVGLLVQSPDGSFGTSGGFVGLSFTPTVLNDGIINLKVNPEVSQLDPARSVRIGGVEVPALTVRRADTTVELRNDQSFAIAGLLQNTSSDSTAQVPWLGDVPILGSLFRSTRYTKNETELVILITPRLVAPASDISDLSTPLDGSTLPSETSKFLLGALEGAPEGGGLTANYGHVFQ